MRDFLPDSRPLLLLAPMQDITNLSFMRVLQRHGGGPDVFVTEYFRVHEDSTIEKHILRSIDENPTDKPVLAQMIGQSIPDLVRTAKRLEEHAVAGIDLNLGCPAPVVCNKSAGGGLLRKLEHLDSILGHLRDAITGRFTVKTRLGFHDPSEFGVLLKIFSKHAIDALSIHGRTVEERYRTPIHPSWIREAVTELDCPIFANGNVVSLETGQALHAQTGAHGLMIGRGAIRNPWLFAQLRQAWTGQVMMRPTLGDVYAYLRDLYEETKSPSHFTETKHVHKLKKYIVFMAQGIDPEDAFEHAIRRATKPEEFWRLCEEFLLQHASEPLNDPPTSSKVFCGFEALTQGMAARFEGGRPQPLQSYNPQADLIDKTK